MSIKDDMLDVQEAVINELVLDNGLNTGGVGESAIDTIHLADDAVTTAKIDDGAVTASKLGGDVDLGIGLTDLSVTQNAASGSGSLTYNNTSGVFSFTPPASSGGGGGGGAGSLSTVLGIGNTTAGNNIVFGDSSGASDDRLTFGAGSDLQIYHDGSHSRIEEQGTGVLFLQTNGTNIQLNKGTSENLLVANVDGSVDLYYDNA